MSFKVAFVSKYFATFVTGKAFLICNLKKDTSNYLHDARKSLLCSWFLTPRALFLFPQSYVFRASRNFIVEVEKKVTAERPIIVLKGLFHPAFLARVDSW